MKRAAPTFNWKLVPSCNFCFSAELLLFLQESKVLKFLGFMWNPLSWVMEAAAIMAIALANGGVCCCTPLIIYFVGNVYFDFCVWMLRMEERRSEMVVQVSFGIAYCYWFCQFPEFFIFTFIRANLLIGKTLLGLSHSLLSIQR